jgi:hypothetical protein
MHPTALVRSLKSSRKLVASSAGPLNPCVSHRLSAITSRVAHSCPQVAGLVRLQAQHALPLTPISPQSLAMINDLGRRHSLPVPPSLRPPASPRLLAERDRLVREAIDWRQSAKDVLSFREIGVFPGVSKCHTCATTNGAVARCVLGLCSRCCRALIFGPGCSAHGIGRGGDGGGGGDDGDGGGDPPAAAAAPAVARPKKRKKTMAAALPTDALPTAALPTDALPTVPLTLGATMDASLVGHRVRALWGEDGDNVHYPATIVGACDLMRPRLTARDPTCDPARPRLTPRHPARPHVTPHDPT